MPFRRISNRRMSFRLQLSFRRMSLREMSIRRMLVSRVSVRRSLSFRYSMRLRSHNIQLSTASNWQRTICLKTGKATNRGYAAYECSWLIILQGWIIAVHVMDLYSLDSVDRWPNSTNSYTNTNAHRNSSTLTLTITQTLTNLIKTCPSP